MEMVISMMLAAIVIGITYASYDIISKSYLSFTRKNESLLEALQLDRLLRKDIASGDSVLKTAEGFIIADSTKKVNYQITPTYTLRIKTRTDTFKVSNQQFVALFEDHETDDGELVDDISLTILFQNEKIPYHYHKQYSAADLVKRHTDALN